MIKLSDCHSFLEVDAMKFIAFDADPGLLHGIKGCDGCYFNINDFSCGLSPPTYCASDDRKDHRIIIWMRIL